MLIWRTICRTCLPKYLQPVHGNKICCSNLHLRVYLNNWTTILPNELLIESTGIGSENYPILVQHILYSRMLLWLLESGMSVRQLNNGK